MNYFILLEIHMSWTKWCNINILGTYAIVNHPCGCPIITESTITDLPPVVIDNPADIFQPIVDAINAQVDYEYKTSPMLCIDGTWQYTCDVYANWVITESKTIDTWISCDDPLPIPPEVVKVSYCDVWWTNTIHIKACLYTFDPLDPENPVETLLSDVDTNEKCNTPKVEVDVEVECNDVTDTWSYITTVITDWVATDPTIVDSWIPCKEDKPDYEQVIVCDPLTKTEHLLTNGIVDDVVTQLSYVDLLRDCEKESDIITDCDLNTESVIVDSKVSIAWSETVLPVRIIEACEDTVSVQVDVECNDETDNRAYFTTTVTNWIAWTPVITDSGIPCTEEKPDYEQIKYCDLDTGTYHIITNSIVWGVSIELSNVDTALDCVPTQVTVDVKYICNEETNVWDAYVTTVTDWVAWTPVITPTTVSCDDEEPDFEQVKVCDALTDTYHIITTSFSEDGVATELSNVDTLEECCKGTPKCVESQEWTYGIDNTGTTYDRANAEYEIRLSDGSTLTWTQTTASAAWWSAQLTEWSESIQASADAAWLAWFVEPRTVNNLNPTDISGNYGSNPTWLPWAPSVPVAQALINWGMAARYVNIQICPWQPVPVGAKVISHDDSPTLNATYDADGRVGLELTTAWAVLWPIQKFVICRCCGKEPVRYLEDWKTLASAWQIPNCYEPCGTLSLLPAPPDRACDFFYDIACDNVNETDDANRVNLVTRRATVCGGEQIAVDYFVEDPSDPSALIAYDLVWDFVDCDTGESIELPPVDWVVVDCEWTEQAETYDMDVRLVGSKNPIEVFNSCDLIDYYTIDFADGLEWLRNRERHDTVPVTSISVDQEQATANGRNFRETHDFSLIPDTDTVLDSFILNDTNNTANELDIQVKDWYVFASEDMLLKYSWASEWYRAVELWQCCWPLELLAESGWFSSNPLREMIFTIPKWTHQIRLWNIDSWGSNSSANLSYSTDWWTTWTTDNNPPNLTLSQVKPTDSCNKWYICCGEYFEIDKVTPLVFDDFTSLCKFDCKVSCCGSSSEEEQYVTGLDTELLSSVSTVPTFPANTKEVVVFNNSWAYVKIETSIWSQIVPPRGTITFEVFDYEEWIKATDISLLSGTFNANSKIFFNYKTIA